MAAYSQDLRERVLQALERGERISSIPCRLEVGRGWIHSVQRRWRDEGNRCSLRIGGYRVSRIAHLQETICDWIEKQPDLTLAELRERLSVEHAIDIKTTALWCQLKKWDLTFKKNVARQRAAARGRAAGTC